MSAADAHFESLKNHFGSGLTRPLSWRLQQLKQLGSFLNDHEHALLQALHSDLGKHAAEAQLTELQFLRSDITATLNTLPRWYKPQKVRNPFLTWPAKSWLIPEPLGVVLILGAWNYPLQLLLAPMIAAVAAGNCVLLKPSEHAPATADVLLHHLPDYLDNAAIKLITGTAEQARKLTAMPFDHIFYTGGEAAAKSILAAAAEHLTPVTLELGGKSPAVVLADAPVQLSARRIVWGKFMNAGQTCIAPDYVLVEEHIKAEFIDALKQEITAFYGKDPQTSNAYGRIIHDAHWQRLVQLLDNEHLVTGGQSDRTTRYLAPTIVDGVTEHSPLMKEEIFGPILPVIGIQSVAEAIERIHHRPKPLALYVFSKQPRRLKRFTQQVSAGNVCYNDTLMFMLNHKLPFGGVGKSGIGRYHGRWGFDTFSHLKPIMHRSFRFDVPLRYPPFSQWKSKVLAWLHR